MLIKQTPDEATRSRSLQSRCELVDIQLLSCESYREADLKTRTEPFTMRLAYKGAGAVYEGGFKAVVDFSVVSFDSATPPAVVFRVDCRFEADYSIGDQAQVAEEELASFSSANAVFNCWPYAREFVQNISARMNMRVPPLPYLRITTAVIATQRRNGTAHYCHSNRTEDARRKTRKP
jgi:hypothetical protein